MESDDRVDPGYAALQAVLAAIADRTADLGERDELFDHIVTLPPLRDWPTAALVQLQGICTAVAGLSRQLEERNPEMSPGPSADI